MPSTHPSRRLLQPAFFALLLGSSPICHTAPAAENAYDVLGKTLHPIVNLFVTETENPRRALQGDFTLLRMTKLPPQFAGSKVSLSLEQPDKVIIRGPVLGEPVTLCRDGQEIWGFPGAHLQAMVNALGELPKRKKKFKLDEFELPFPEKNLVFLPVLFQVQDQGSQPVNEVLCRILDVRLMPQLAHSLEVEDWAARAWITPDYKLAKLQVARPGWEIVVSVERLVFLESLPKETWKPSEVEAVDLLRLDAPQLKQVLDALKAKRKPAESGSDDDSAPAR
jgi:hypothetical protein